MLRLIAFDSDDLDVISAQLQDAAVRASQMAYLPKEQRFALAVERCLRCQKGEQTGDLIVAGLHFERVLGVQSIGINPKSDGQFRLMAVRFEADDLPSGYVLLMFDDGALIKLEVECLEASLQDMAEAQGGFARLIDFRSPDFNERFAALVAEERGSQQAVDDTVRAILEDVKKRGDAALFDYTQKFDGFELSKTNICVSREEIEQAVAITEPDVLGALKLAAARIRAHHEKQLPQNMRYQDALGVELGTRWSAVEAAGLYVPGGTASYPSSVLMNALPAKVAGVERLAMVVPAQRGVLSPTVLAAAHIAGVDEIYRVGGAQAIGALAYGTASIAPVNVIVGPGNAYVAAAKRLVYGHVGIDMVAGPSEVVVVADKSAKAEWIAADLLAQAEHDQTAQAIVITLDQALAARIIAEVERQCAALPRQAIAREAWRNYGAVVVVENLEQAAVCVNKLAPEHLELHLEDSEAFVPLVRHAGAIFIGEHTPEAIGDYVGGSNHVLPTARAARYASGLSVYDFMKRTSVLRCSADHLRALGPAAVTLARSEGLEAHARSVLVRLNDNP